MLTTSTSQRGAAAVLWLAVTCGLLVGVGVAATTAMADIGGTHAEAAADAAAHAAAGEIAKDANRDSLSLEAQLGQASCGLDNGAAGAGPIDDTAGGDQAQRANEACTAARRPAEVAAKANGAELVQFWVGPDTNDYAHGGAGRIVVTATVRAKGPLQAIRGVCAQSDGNDGLCYIEAVAGAREVG